MWHWKQNSPNDFGFVRRGAKKDGKSRAWLWMTLVGGGIERGEEKGKKKRQPSGTFASLALHHQLHWSILLRITSLYCEVSVSRYQLSVCLLSVCVGVCLSPSAAMVKSLGKPHPKKNRVYLGIAQIAIWPPLLRKSGHFVAQLFCRKWENSLNSNFDFGNEYFDSD